MHVRKHVTDDLSKMLTVRTANIRNKTILKSIRIRGEPMRTGDNQGEPVRTRQSQ